jgi:hypothetical protein
MGVRPDVRALADLGVVPTVCSTCARADRQSTSRVSGPISQPSPITVSPCRMVPG